MAQPSPPFDWRTLAADLFAYHEQVVDRLARQNPSVDHDLLHDAFVQTILQISREPDRFDPARGSIPAFLRGATKRTLRTLLRSDASRRKREQKKGESHVAHQRSAARGILDELADGELAAKARAEVAQTEEERQVLRLWELGVEEPGAYARALSIEDKPKDEQHAIVKKIRDRLTVRLRRLKDRGRGAAPHQTNPTTRPACRRRSSPSPRPTRSGWGTGWRVTSTRNSSRPIAWRKS
jgi:hypothetical protein